MCRRLGLRTNLWSALTHELPTASPLTELALRECLIELRQTILPRLQDLAWVADIDRPHFQASDRVVIEQVFNVRPRELDGGCRIIMERDP